MKTALLLALLLWQTAPGTQTESSAQETFRYKRTITLPAAPGPACAILAPAIFPHAGISLRDLRLVQGGHEIPYAITLSEPGQPDADTAIVRNLTLRKRAVAFDLEMPRRRYTDVILDLDARNFIATATVSGTRDPNYSHQTQLGDFTLFDLATQHLSRSTTLPLQETDLPYLHIELNVSTVPPAAPLTPQTLLRMVRGVTVPPSREAQSLYTTALTSGRITQRDRQSFASFLLPERIPIERVSFDLAPAYKSNFSRDVYITDHPRSAPAILAAQRDDTLQQSSPPPTALSRSTIPATGTSADTTGATSETSAGNIFRVHLAQAGREINQQQLSVPVTLGSNMQSPATVLITVVNGDDAPLPLTAIRLEMRQRKICFNAQPASQTPITLFYGDPALPAPQYDAAHLFAPSIDPQAALLGPEQINPVYRNPPDPRPLNERHPKILWIIFIPILCLLYAIAVHSSKPVHDK